MERFNKRYASDEGFRDFIDTTNKDEVLNYYGYLLYRRFGVNTTSVAAKWVNPKVLDLISLIKYFEKEGEFEKCTHLINIQNKMKEL